jgi:hypothetical protein
MSRKYDVQSVVGTSGVIEDLNTRNASDICIAAQQSPSITAVMRWIHEYIVKPNANLGRTGAVCPFVTPALRLRCLWISVIDREISTATEVSEILLACLTKYESDAFAVQDDGGLKTLLIAFPRIRADEAAAIVDTAHKQVKPEVVERGLMLGEFHPRSVTQGAHNPAFHAGRSPMPLFVLRRMVPGDLLFLNNRSDPLERRVRYLRAYLRALEPILSKERADEARSALEESQAKL